GSRLARAPRHFVGRIDQIDGDFGHVWKREDRIAAPVEARDRAAAEGELLDQRAAHGLHDVALDLVAQAVGVDDLPALVRHEHAVDFDLSGRAIHGHVRDNPDIGAHRLVFHVREAASARQGTAVARTRPARLPLRERAQALYQLEPASIGEVADADLERIGTRYGGD